MTFHANSVVADIQTYHTYLQNASFADHLNHNEFLYTKLRAKMTAINTNVLIQAASELQRHLDSMEDFPTYVQQAIQIAHLSYVCKQRGWFRLHVCDGQNVVLRRSLLSMTSNLCCGMTPVVQVRALYPLPACRHRFKLSQHSNP